MQVQAAFPTAIAAAVPAAPVMPAGGQQQGFGCGWFDSSYELSEGLVVVEEADSVLFQLWSQAQGGRQLH